jgi:hypothetical protein
MDERNPLFNVRGDVNGVALQPFLRSELPQLNLQPEEKRVESAIKLRCPLEDVVAHAVLIAPVSSFSKQYQTYLESLTPEVALASLPLTQMHPADYAEQTGYDCTKMGQAAAGHDFGSTFVRHGRPMKMSWCAYNVKDEADPTSPTTDAFWA